MRFAHDAQVMPVIGSSRCSLRRITAHLLREGDGVDAALVLELEEQAVAARGRERRREGDLAASPRSGGRAGRRGRPRAARPGARRRRGTARCATGSPSLRDREAQLGLVARAGVGGVEAHVVAAVGDRGRARARAAAQVGGAVDAQVARERVRLAVAREVGEQRGRSRRRRAARRVVQVPSAPCSGAGAGSRSGRGGRRSGACAWCARRRSRARSRRARRRCGTQRLGAAAAQLGVVDDEAQAVGGAPGRGRGAPAAPCSSPRRRAPAPRRPALRAVASPRPRTAEQQHQPGGAERARGDTRSPRRHASDRLGGSCESSRGGAVRIRPGGYGRCRNVTGHHRRWIDVDATSPSTAIREGRRRSARRQARGHLAPTQPPSGRPTAPRPVPSGPGPGPPRPGRLRDLRPRGRPHRRPPRRRRRARAGTRTPTARPPGGRRSPSRTPLGISIRVRPSLTANCSGSGMPSEPSSPNGSRPRASR